MPPVLIHGVVTDLNRLKVLLRTNDIHNIYFKFTKNSTLIFTNSEVSYNKLLQYTKTQATADEGAHRSQFHNYTPAIQKTHSYVICGLDLQPTPEKVQNALLIEYEIETKAVYEIKPITSPRCLIITSSAITVNLLTQTVKHLMAVKVIFEQRHNKKDTVSSLQIFESRNLKLY